MVLLPLSQAGLDSSGAFSIFCVLAVFIVGSVLFKLRGSRLKLYSVLELAFALATGFYAGERILGATLNHRHGEGFAAFGAAVYLLIRGLDNFQKAQKETPDTKALDQCSARVP